MNDIKCELECDKTATHVSTVQTKDYRESSFFCDDHKDRGYVPGKKIER